jgi:5'-nucleotidase (lipoprotein e(P4) family)
MRRPVLPLTFVLFATVGCRSGAPGAPPAPPVPRTAPTASPAASSAADAGHVPLAIRWARLSAEHRAAYLEVFVAATAHVEREARGRAPGTWGIVSDADETLLDNSTYQLEQARRGLPFEPGSWRAWTARREALPQPGAAAFLGRVHQLGGRIAIVTNRAESECADTTEVFRAHGLVYDLMLCMPDAGPSDKNPRFAAVERGTTPAGLPPLDVVAFLGDNIRDFPGLDQSIRQDPDSAFALFGTRFFLLPNPMYGSWESND